MPVLKCKCVKPRFEMFADGDQAEVLVHLKLCPRGFKDVGITAKHILQEKVELIRSRFEDVVNVYLTSLRTLSIPSSLFEVLNLSKFSLM